LNAVGFERAFYKRSNKLTSALTTAVRVNRSLEGNACPPPEEESEGPRQKNFGQPD
jgi:hypothetical protein